MAALFPDDDVYIYEVEKEGGGGAEPAAEGSKPDSTTNISDEEDTLSTKTTDDADADAAAGENTVSQGPRGPWSEEVIPNSVPGEQFVNFRLAPGEYLLQCPYENSHRVLPMRMGNHMYKCRRNYANKMKAQGLCDRLVPCPWNPHHLVSEVELEYHSGQCCDRYITEKEAKAHLRNASKLIPHPELDQPGDEDWGLLPNKYASYDPKKKLAAEPIFYQPKMLSKAEKVKYREEQRRKFYHQASGPFWESYSNPRLDREFGIIPAAEHEAAEAAGASSSSPAAPAPWTVPRADPNPKSKPKENEAKAAGPATLTDNFSEWGLLRMDELKLKLKGNKSVGRETEKSKLKRRDGDKSRSAKDRSKNNLDTELGSPSAHPEPEPELK